MTGVVHSAMVLGFSVYQILWLFVVYSFVGFVLEVAFFAACDGVLESRTGLLYLPLRPLYGIGGCLFAFLLERFAAHPGLVFLLGALVATVVEYLASLLTDTLFGAVSWDYSDKLLNVRGRVCLAYSLCWGALALVALYLLDLPILALLGLLPRKTGEVVLIVLMVLVLLSSVLTLAALARTRARVSVLKAALPDEVPDAASTRWGRSIGRRAPDAVLINSFPRMTSVMELRELTGQNRIWIRIPTFSLQTDGPLGTPRDRARSSFEMIEVRSSLSRSGLLGSFLLDRRPRRATKPHAPFLPRRRRRRTRTC